MNKPGIPQGTRDFNANTIRKRNFILTTIKNVFEKYAFEPLETPAMENLDTLMGKYGEEGDRLIFKVLNNGLNDPKNIDKAKLGFEKLLEGKTTNELTERALKYDLTIPFARYVAMNIGKLTFPYKRYQIQPVWRADRPQKGRYREFTQCDADVVGSHSLIIEAELANIYHEAFTTLGLYDYSLKINSRKMLTALAHICGSPHGLIDITTAIDKLDKIGIQKVKIELSERGLSEKQIDIIEQYLNITGTNEEKIAQAIALFADNAEANRGLEEITNVIKKASSANLVVDFSLARGLNYYTGIIFEVKAPSEVSIGSIGGGGRYDDLTSLFGVKESVPGVGISFGIDRIYDVLEELNLFPENIGNTVKAIFFNMGETESIFAYNVMQNIRNKGVACELFYESAKITKQFSYAEKKNIQYAIIIGSKEIEQNYCQVKNLSTGIQELVILDNLYDYLNSN
ncbi:histidine--tRNA ligase [Ferruginibacter sp. SUN002]|uniref:histidine--tRNA ligase n=1 Tax=Ferruginibacter sp. SUN002 TaxID=2937789 RepID=UPI003D360A98